MANEVLCFDRKSTGGASRTTRTFKNRKWEYLQFERKPLEDEQKRIKDVVTMKTTEYVWHQGTSGFLLNLIGEEAAHDRLEKLFKELASSFEIQSREHDRAD